MKVITHESDKGFQKVALLLVVFNILYITISIYGAIGFKFLQGLYDELGITVFVLINLIFSYTKGMIRFYVGPLWMERMYVLFLTTGLAGVLYILINMLVSEFPV